MGAMMACIAVICPLTRSLDLTEWHAGLTVSVVGLMWMLASWPLGRASDRYGRRTIAATDLTGIGLACLDRGIRAGRLSVDDVVLVRSSACGKTRDMPSTRLR